MLLILKSKKYNISSFSLFVLLGLLFGLMLNGINFLNENSSFTGIELSTVDRFTMSLSDDSFLSSKGDLIFKGNLLFSMNNQQIGGSSSGRVLVLGKKSTKQYFQGEILEFDSNLKKLDKSKDYSYIAYSAQEPLRISWKATVFKYRAEIKNNIESQINKMPPDVSSLFIALFSGNSDFLNNDIKSSFRKSGTIHLLALSGFHVALIVILLTFALKPLLGRKSAFLLTLPFIIFYLFFAGSGPSLLRAVLMYTIGGLFYLLDKKIKLFSLLLITAFAQLLIYPDQGFNLSYQLSYSALFGIIFFGKLIQYRIKPWFPSFLSYPLAASIGAQITTAPLLIYHFKEVYPIGLISALFLTPFISLFMWIGILSLVSSFCNFSMIFSVCTFLNEKIYKLTIWCSNLFSSFKMISFSSKSSIFLYLSLLLIIVVSFYIDFWRINDRRTYIKLKLRFAIRNKSSS